MPEVDVPHICNILKGLTRGRYRADVDNITRSNIRIVLENVLVTNQHLINTFTALLRADMGDDQFYKKYPRGPFPHYLREILEPYIAEHGDKIEDEISAIKAKYIELDQIDHRQYMKSLTNRELLDLSKPYELLVSILKTTDERGFIYKRSQYGYFVGSLVNIVLDEYEAKNGVSWPQADFEVLFARNRSLIYNTEKDMLPTYRKILNDEDYDKLKKSFILYKEENQ